MKSNLRTTIIVADLGQLRAFRVKPRDVTGDSMVFEEIQLDSHGHEPQPIGELVSDQAGRFPRGGGAGMSNGEEHEVTREMKERAMVFMADQIVSIIQSEKSEDWKLAAPRAIASRLVDKVAPGVRERLMETEYANLTGQPLKMIEKRLL
jgi:hypothetical protein